MCIKRDLCSSCCAHCAEHVELLEGRKNIWGAIFWYFCVPSDLWQLVVASNSHGKERKGGPLGWLKKRSTCEEDKSTGAGCAWIGSVASLRAKFLLVSVLWSKPNNKKWTVKQTRKRCNFAMSLVSILNCLNFTQKHKWSNRVYNWLVEGRVGTFCQIWKQNPIVWNRISVHKGFPSSLLMASVTLQHISACFHLHGGNVQRECSTLLVEACTWNCH